MTEYKQPETRIRECILTTNNGDVTKQYFPEAWTGRYENKWSFLFRGKKEFYSIFPKRFDLEYIISLIQIKEPKINYNTKCFLDLDQCKIFIDYYLNKDYERWLNDYKYIENNYIKYP